MDIIQSHTHSLRFRINKNVSCSCESKWKKFKEKCEYGDNFDISIMIKNNLQSENNKKLLVLKGDGGIGMCDKKITFRHKYKSDVDYRDYGYDYGLFFCLNNDSDNDIVLNVSNSQNDKWTYDDLDDISNAFIKVATKFTKTKYINGYIELESKKISLDNSDNSDNSNDSYN